MIYGVFNIEKDFSQSREPVEIPLEAPGPLEYLAQGPLKLAVGPTGVDTLDQERTLLQDPDRGLILAFQGKIFNQQELCQTFGTESRGHPQSIELIARAYLRDGPEGFAKLNGSFACVLWDQRKRCLLLVRDHLGIETLYYSSSGGQLVFSCSLKTLSRALPRSKALNEGALREYLLFNYNPGQETLFQGIRKLRPAHYLKWEKGRAEEKRFWYLSFRRGERKAEPQYQEELLALMRQAVELRADAKDKAVGAFLSGGMDSSTVVGLLRPILLGELHTFSFHCAGKSFDESHYAQVMAHHYGTIHHQMEFTPEKVDVIAQVVESQEEPFCDIGIEIASYLLGQECRASVPYVLTGDGGDELFAGHPVYLADRVARIYDRVPHLIRQPLSKVLQALPDTNKKKSLVVKAKRFAYSCNFPSELYGNRWRIYYTDDELHRLFSGDSRRSNSEFDPYGDLRRLYKEADGVEDLDKALYGDYHTVVDFYLRRMALVRRFGVEARFPMLDYRLVEYAATIPPDLKIRQGSDTKYILRNTMKGLLPDEIIFRKDKLGHSVPMKNWMRDSKFVRDFVRDILCEEAVRSRGLFDPKYVQAMISQHLRRTHNHSHRLWALVVLELWLRQNKN